MTDGCLERERFLGLRDGVFLKVRGLYVSELGSVVASEGFEEGLLGDFGDGVVPAGRPLFGGDVYDQVCDMYFHAEEIEAGIGALLGGGGSSEEVEGVLIDLGVTSACVAYSALGVKGVLHGIIRDVLEEVEDRMDGAETPRVEGLCGDEFGGCLGGVDDSELGLASRRLAVVLGVGAGDAVEVGRVCVGCRSAGLAFCVAVDDFVGGEFGDLGSWFGGLGRLYGCATRFELGVVGLMGVCGFYGGRLG